MVVEVLGLAVRVAEHGWGCPALDQVNVHEVSWRSRQAQDQGAGSVDGQGLDGVVEGGDGGLRAEGRVIEDGLAEHAADLAHDGGGAHVVAGDVADGDGEGGAAARPGRGGMWKQSYQSPPTRSSLAAGRYSAAVSRPGVAGTSLSIAAWR